MKRKKIKLGLIGLGHLGKYHLKHLASFDFLEIVGIYDLDEKVTDDLALEYNLPIAKSLEKLLDIAEAVSIVTPTNTHAEIALKALKEENYLKRFVQISSPEVYGSCQGVIKEDAPLSPSTPYAASKAAGDLSLLPFFKNFDFP